MQLTRNIVRGFSGETVYAIINLVKGAFAGMKALDALNGNCVKSTHTDEYLEITRVELGALPPSLTSLVLDGCFTTEIALPEATNLTELYAHRHLLTSSHLTA
ncbi:hypothetical protein SDRG_12224 [Saprolegnia diclina VS20]|uniref:Uncharacterized protein n=1 Tax=Saprolegnia diclina (strain VS20) TaxID=1156394 RepID=T0RJ74_SAPDV|nr:hypothetical protein SDRG_12224 [Saprolegnia diclina VS20]EQC29942.1 hypothetical protein SDRG_12224 [Saprolegnia diclina VS20]|eukprot:XP_008616509.1 hypothetical protein SDRG_12224 [Saprolegnia diclina VS20]